MIYDLIIIGGGPAGITAGIYAGRQKMQTLLITKEFGGQMGKKATEVCNYPGYERISGADLIKKFTDQLEKQPDVKIEFGEVIKIEKKDNIFVVFLEKEKFSAKTVIIAGGADPRPLEAKGEKEYIGKGISYCVACDGPIFKNKTVAVVGGGNAGYEAAIFMTNYSPKIYILQRDETSTADLQNQQEVKDSDKIEIIKNAVVTEVKGSVMLEELLYEDQKTKEIKTLKVEGIFIEIGRQPATSFAKGLVDFNERDEIIVEFETMQTKTPGLFAAGDINVGRFKQIVTSAGEGCKALLAAYEYLRKLK